MMQFVKNCKTSSIILCMYMIPIFIFGTYYRDDNGRVVSQYFDWDLDGRPLTDVIIKFLNFGGRLTDIAPMSQLIAIIISSITCGIICSFIVKSNKLSVIISSTMLFISPFYIQNLLYRFDVVTMALSILFAAVPFLINCKIKSYIHAIVSFVSITCLLTTYQASLPVFYSFILISFLTSDDLKNNIIRVFSGLSSLVVYYFVISPMYVGGGYAKYRAESIDTSSGSIIDTISSNIYTLLKTAHILIDFKFILVFSLLIAMALLKLAILIKNKKINYKNT
ncbi:glucosyltransferase domain-containing protein, partial [Morganella morganii]